MHDRLYFPNLELQLEEFLGKTRSDVIQDLLRQLIVGLDIVVPFACQLECLVWVVDTEHETVVAYEIISSQLYEYSEQEAMLRLTDLLSDKLHDGGVEVA